MAGAANAGGPDLHFTYKTPTPGELEQGDVLDLRDDLKLLVSQAYPGGIGETTTHVMVLTQSCDLVRRDGHVKAGFVTLALVRPLHVVLEAEVSRRQTLFERRARVLAASTWSEVQSFVRRLINNNESEYMFLEADAAKSLPEDSCAFLRLPVALRLDDSRYDALLAARVLGLSDVFQSKLGWMVADIYSRVATRDWDDQEQQRKLNNLIQRQLGIKPCDDDRLAAARAAYRDSDALPELLQQQVFRLKYDDKKARYIKAACTALRTTLPKAQRDLVAFADRRFVRPLRPPVEGAPSEGASITAVAKGGPTEAPPPAATAKSTSADVASTAGQVMSHETAGQALERFAEQIQELLEKLPDALERELRNDPEITALSRR